MAGAYYQYIVKLLMVGAERVGKTSLLLRFTEGIFSSDQRATIGNKLTTSSTLFLYHALFIYLYVYSVLSIVLLLH